MIRGELRYFLRGILGVPALLFLFLYAVYGRHLPGVLDVLRARSSQLLTGDARFHQFTGGFCANIWISIVAMILAVVGGMLLGIGLVSPSRALRWACGLVMNLLRNSPWLVILYAMLYLLPFEFTLFGVDITFSPAWKSVIGLALPVAANFAEIFRGGVQAVPFAQWESARSLGYRRTQVLRRVIIPQAVPLMLPNVVNLYAALFIGTSLIVVTGATDVLTMARTIVATEGGRLATAVYLYVLALFFLFSFPIAVSSRWLEDRLRSGT
jgi:polar amino acid transport system permease protein